MHAILKALLTVTAGAGAFYGAAQWSRQGSPDADPEGDIVAAVTRPAPSGRAPGTVASRTAAEDDAIAVLSARRALSPEAGAFAPLNWQPPPPAPAAPPPPPAVAAAPAPPAPPAAPTVPPLPFTFVGMAERGADRPQAYLAKGDALLVVSVGDIVENQSYRIDALSPTGVVVTYLPLNKQQTINVPGESR